MLDFNVKFRKLSGGGNVHIMHSWYGLQRPFPDPTPPILKHWLHLWLSSSLCGHIFINKMVHLVCELCQTWWPWPSMSWFHNGNQLFPMEL